MMTIERPNVKSENAHYLKGHASWLYCNKCNKTVAYLCYVTYLYFRFDFICACGCRGLVENMYGDIYLQDLSSDELARNPSNKRYCCPNDSSALFSPVPKNLKSYNAEIICRKCKTRYVTHEKFYTG